MGLVSLCLHVGEAPSEDELSLAVKLAARIIPDGWDTMAEQVSCWGQVLRGQSDLFTLLYAKGLPKCGANHWCTSATRLDKKLPIYGILPTP